MPPTSQPSRTKLLQQLTQSLYRFDCPSPLAIGEYELKVSPSTDQVQVAQHLLDCLECASELGTLRTYLKAVPSTQTPQLLERVARVVARLITPPPGLSLAGVRDAHGTQVQVFEVGDLMLTIGPGLQGSPGLASILGLFEVVGSALAQGRVELIAEDGVSRETRLDDLGGFEFSELPEGSYELHIELPDRLVVLDGLVVQAQ